MRYMMINKSNAYFDAGNPPSPEQLARIGKFMEEAAKAGVLLASEGLRPSALGARISVTGGKLTVTDGPFTEAKELIGGFAIVQASSKAEAIEMAKQFAVVHGGDVEVEIRQLSEPEDFAPPGTGRAVSGD